MDPYDPIREVIDKGRAMAEVWADWCMDWHPEYAAFLEALHNLEVWMDDPRMVNVR